MGVVTHLTAGGAPGDLRAVDVEVRGSPLRVGIEKSAGLGPHAAAARTVFDVDRLKSSNWWRNQPGTSGSRRAPKLITDSGMVFRPSG